MICVLFELVGLVFVLLLVGLAYDGLLLICDLIGLVLFSCVLVVLMLV